jgi:hypothetical protein
MFSVSCVFFLRTVQTRGQQSAVCGSHVALENFLCGPSHDLGISQCQKKSKTFLLLRSTNIYIYTHTYYASTKAKQSQKEKEKDLHETNRNFVDVG